MNYKIRLRKEPEGSYTVFVPSLEGCITYGESVDAAKMNAIEAIKLYIESLVADGLSVPTDENFLEMNLQVSNVGLSLKAADKTIESSGV